MTLKLKISLRPRDLTTDENKWGVMTLVHVEVEHELGCR